MNHKFWLSFLLSAVMVSGAFAQTKVLKADARLRPPEILIDEKTGTVSGPLPEVINEAARSIGYAVEWRSVPFTRSLEQLKNGETDIVPRLVMTEERKELLNSSAPSVCNGQKFNSW